MPTLYSKNFNLPDQTRSPEKSKIDMIELGEFKASRITLQPGWKWSECTKSIAGTPSCQAAHVGLCQSGRLKMVADDGYELEITAGDFYLLGPGHDGWVVGNEPVVVYEFEASAVESYG